MKMSLTVQQLLSDAKRLSTRLRDHDQTADTLISRAQEVLKQVDAMRQYQEDIENLNEVAHNRPRAQLVLGIQQENRHIRTLQQENKELRAALEEHQNALELIMSKYRQHVTRLVNTPRPELTSALTSDQVDMLAEKTEKVCEMAAVMKEAVRMDEENSNMQQETMARLVTENKGLRELLDISQKSNSTGKVKRAVTSVHKEIQTDSSLASSSAGTRQSPVVEQEVTVTLPMPPQPKPPPRSPKPAKIAAPEQTSDARESVETGLSDNCELGDSDETGSEDESIKYDTIKKQKKTTEAVANTVEETELEKPRELSVDKVGKLEDRVQEEQDEEKKLSPSEEVVCPLVEQLVSDSIPQDSDSCFSDASSKGSEEPEKISKKGKQNSKTSPKKNKNKQK